MINHSKAEPPTNSVQRHPTFFMEPLFVQVQNTLFQIPRVAFEGREGSPFADAASLPAQQGGDSASMAEGRTSDQPVHLTVETRDFENLLHVMYASGLLIPNYPTEISHDQWRSALRLASLWNFEDIRAKAITAVDNIADPFEYISLAREFHIRRWLITGYRQLITGKAETLEPSRCAAALGWETLALLYYARSEYGSKDPRCLAEYLNSGKSGIGYTCNDCTSQQLHIYKPPVDPVHKAGTQCPLYGKSIKFSAIAPGPGIGRAETQGSTLADFSHDIEPSLKVLIERIFEEELKGMHD